jgi:hypothetical protein
MEQNLVKLIISNLILIAIMLYFFGFVLTGQILSTLFWVGLVIVLIRIVITSAKEASPKKH